MSELAASGLLTSGGPSDFVASGALLCSASVFDASGGVVGSEPFFSVVASTAALSDAVSVAFSVDLSVEFSVAFSVESGSGFLSDLSSCCLSFF